MNYLDYKHCQYFKEAEEKEHCPFSVTCKDDCVFSLLPLKEENEELYKENIGLDMRIGSLEAEANENESLNEQIDDLQRQLSDVYYLIATDLPDFLKGNDVDFPDFSPLDITYTQQEKLENIYKAFKKEEQMKIKIVAEDKYMPKYANETDACMDLKAKLDEPILIEPGETKVIPSGVQVAIPEGYVMKMYVRSSTGIKKQLCLANGTGIIDSGYRDEIKMALHNFGTGITRIEDGDRVCQFVIIPFPKIELEKTTDNDDFRNGDRGGGIGSTGE